MAWRRGGCAVSMLVPLPGNELMCRRGQHNAHALSRQMGW